MKKIIYCLITVLLLAAIAVTASSCGSGEPYEDPEPNILYFSLNEDEQSFSVSRNTDDLSGEIVIPATYEGKPVTGINYNAFENCTGITSIVLPDSITSIDEFAFSGCTGLTDITIPDSIKTISRGAFYGCIGLTNMQIPEGVTVVGEQVFDGCTNILTCENGIYYVDKWAVASDENITAITLREDTVGIADNVFIGREIESEELPSIKIPVSVAYIGEYAFFDCDGVESIEISVGVKSIGAFAFANLDILEKLEIPSSVISIGAGAFSDCKDLESITVDPANPVYYSRANCVIETATKTLVMGCYKSVIPADGSITSIGNFAFAGCPYIHEINIPSSVTSIGEAAFADCYGIENIKIPNGVTEIADSAFSGCDNLKTIELPDSLTSIGAFAFFWCEELTGIIIPRNVTYIGATAFRYCEKMEYIAFEDINGWHVTDLSNPDAGELMIDVSSAAFNADTMVIGDRYFNKK